jgi:uncharacterized protein (TIGR03083 family)
MDSVLSIETDVRTWVEALRSSHDSLVAEVTTLAPEQLGAESYCRGWDVAQVLSHLGSGAEIGLLGLERALVDAPPLEREDLPIIWGRWNALSPAEKANEMVVWDRRFVSVLQGLDNSSLNSLHVELFGRSINAASIVALRLGEHALHSWDVASTFNPVAEVLPTSVELLVDRVPFIAGRLGKSDRASGKEQIEIRTFRPERRFFLSVLDRVALSDKVDGEPEGTLELPAAALLRLVYGRLDRRHTPPGVHVEGRADLDELRQIFSGF